MPHALILVLQWATGPRLLHAQCREELPIRPLPPRPALRALESGKVDRERTLFRVNPLRRAPPRGCSREHPPVGKKGPIQCRGMLRRYGSSLWQTGLIRVRIADVPIIGLIRTSLTTRTARTARGAQCQSLLQSLQPESPNVFQSRLIAGIDPPAKATPGDRLSIFQGNGLDG